MEKFSSLARFMDRHVLLSCLLISSLVGPLAAGAVIDLRLDFSDRNASPGDGWNTFGDQAAVRADTDLIDFTTGQPSGVHFSSPDFVTTVESYNQWPSATGPAWLDADKNAAKDCMQGYSGAATYTFTFSGLDPAKTYLVELVSSCSGSGASRWQNWRLNGVVGEVYDASGYVRDAGIGTASPAFSAVYDGYDKGRWLRWDGVVPNADGTVHLVDQAGLSGYSYLNALRLTEVVPEPATLMLLAFGGLSALGSCRRGR